MLKHMWLTWELVKTWLVGLGWSIRFYTSENSHVLWTPLWNSELSRYLFIFIYLIFLLIGCLWNYRLLWILSLVFSHFQHLSFQRQVYTSIYRHTLAQIIVCTHTHTRTDTSMHTRWCIDFCICDLSYVCVRDIQVWMVYSVLDLFIKHCIKNENWADHFLSINH